MPEQVVVCRALLFDLDGVLIDSTPAVARVWRQWALERGFDPAKVVRTALENAVSVASVLLLTEATMTEIPEPKRERATEPEMGM